MPLEAQTRLLRVLQEGEYTTVGGRTPIKADVRDHRRHQHATCAADPPGPVPRGSVLPPQRRADPPAAAARAQPRTSPTWSGTSSRSVEREGLPLKTIDAGGARAAEALSLAGQRARAGEPDAPSGGALSAGDDHRATSSRRELDQPALATAPAEASATRRRCRARSSGISPTISPSIGDGLPPPGLYDRVLREVERPLISAALARRAATRSRRPSCSGSTATRCARRSATSTSRWSAAAKLATVLRRQ